MSRLKLVVLFLCLSIPAKADQCLERFYSDKHLKKYKNQEIRNVMVSLHDEYIRLPKPDENGHHSKSIHHVHLQIQLVKNKKTFVADVKGICNNELGGTEWNKVLQKQVWFNTVQCRLEKNLGQLTLYKRTGKKHEYLGELSKDAKLRVINYQSQDGETISVPRGDLKFGLNRIQNPSYRKCTEIVMMPRTTTVPRFWNEMILYSIRNDKARPTVTARNLYHLSMAMWDAYAAFDQNQPQWSRTSKRMTASTKNLKSARDEAMSFAAYTLLKERYKNAPGNVNPLEPEIDHEPSQVINQALDFSMKKLGYKLSFAQKSGSPAKLGTDIANAILKTYFKDGSREAEDYAHDTSYVAINNKYPLDITQTGIRIPIDARDKEWNPIWPVLGGQRFDQHVNIDFWNFLFVPGAVDQGGNEEEALRSPLTLFWGKLNHTFSDLSAFRSTTKEGVYFDPCPNSKSISDLCEVYPKFNDQQKRQLIEENLDVARFSSILSPIDLKKLGKDFDGDGQPDENPGAQFIDISPIAMGNNTLGSNDGKGRGTFNPVNPDKPYQKTMVRLGDFGRTIAEFWADGPDSETPPGHWNTIFNYVVDQKAKVEEKPFRFFGQGSELSREEFELKTYLVLNGSLHDAAVVAWGIKGFYQGNRPISVIRKLARMAETDEKFAKELVTYAPDLLKMVEHPKGSGKKRLVIKSWRGQPYGYGQDVDGGAQDHRDYSLRSQEEVDFYRDFNEGQGDHWGIGGVGWILAENWIPYQRQTFVTPPFPGFISGHSTFSRAAAEVLAGVTGSEFFPGGLGTYPAPQLHFEKGPYENFEFQWATYFDASDQSGISRLYGGIHASYDDLPARVIGSKIGKAAVQKAKVFFRK